MNTYTIETTTGRRFDIQANDSMGAIFAAHNRLDHSRQERVQNVLTSLGTVECDVCGTSVEPKDIVISRIVIGPKDEPEPGTDRRRCAFCHHQSVLTWMYQNPDVAEQG